MEVFITFQNVLLLWTYCIHHYVRNKFGKQKPWVLKWCQAGIETFKKSFQEWKGSNDSCKIAFFQLKQALEEAEAQYPKYELEYKKCK